MTGGEYRERLLAALDRANPQTGDPVWDRFWRLAFDHWVHVCPSCKSRLPDYLAVRFHGDLPLADVYCSRGCTETLIAAALKR